MYRSQIHATTLLLLAAAVCLPASGASRNPPKLSDVGDIVEAAGKKHGGVERIERLGSLKTEDTYFHIFHTKSDSGSYRVIVFDNDKQYLGFYDTMEYEPFKTDGDGEGRACGVVLKKFDPESRTIWYTRIPFGNDGPWESIRTKAQINMPLRNRTIYRFTPTPAYSPPPVTTVNRKWSPKGMYAPDGRLAMVTEDFIYIQASDGCIDTWNRTVFSNDDREYIKSIAGSPDQQVEQTRSSSRSSYRNRPVSAESAAGENLIANGDFSKGSAKWKGDRKIVYETSAGQNKVCKLEVDEVDTATFYQKIKVKGYKRLTLTYRVRISKDYRSGNPDIPYYENFTGDKSKYVSIGYTKKPALPVDEWTEFEVVMQLYPSHEDFSEEIPFDSSFGELSFTVQPGYSGYVMFDDISVTGE